MSDERDDYMDEEEDSRGSRTRVVLVAVLVVLFLMLAGLGYFITRVITPSGRPASTKDTPVGLEWIRSLYGFGPKSTDMLFRPLDASFGPDGAVYATDPQRARIFVFRSDGEFERLVSAGAPATGKGRMYRPDRITTDEDGNLYVADNAGEKMLVFSPTGEFLREWEVPRPTDAAVDGDRIYVTTAFGVAVNKLDGTLISTWGQRGYGPEQFQNPRGIVVAEDGTVYIGDTLNGRIKAYTPEGKLKWVWPENKRTAKPTGVRPSTEDATLQLPTGLCLDGKGRLVLVDAFGFDIIVLQPSDKGAKFVARYGGNGTKDGYFQYPSGIAYDPARDWFAVADTFNNRVQIVRLPGSTSNVVGTAVVRAATGPLWLCVLPLVLLLAALVVALMRRRSRRDDREADDEGSEGDDGAS